MAGILGSVDRPAGGGDRLVEVANEHGGADNITVVVVDVQVGEAVRRHGQGQPLGRRRRRRHGAAAGAAAAAAAGGVEAPLD